MHVPDIFWDKPASKVPAEDLVPGRSHIPYQTFGES